MLICGMALWLYKWLESEPVQQIPYTLLNIENRSLTHYYKYI